MIKIRIFKEIKSRKFFFIEKDKKRKKFYHILIKIEVLKEIKKF